MTTLYRISDGGYKKDKLEFADKFYCLENYIEVFGKENLIVFADNCKEVPLIVTVEVVLSQLPEIFTCCPLYPHPQRDAESFCCSTMPDDITAGKRNCENDETGRSKLNKRQERIIRMA